MATRWYRSKRNQLLVLLFIVVCVAYYTYIHREYTLELDITRRYINRKLEEALKREKGKGCEIPVLNPFDEEVMQFEKEIQNVKCSGTDWVKCHLSTCKVVPEILASTKNIVCVYQDILHQSDQKYILGPAVKVYGDRSHVLVDSDHVKVRCSGKQNEDLLPKRWKGCTLGFRTTVHPQPAPIGRENTINVLILGFDSTSKNGFIRRMPNSYAMLTQELKAIVLNGYNIVGDGTPAALFPILTGKTELELPDVRKSTGNKGTFDNMPFIFYKLRDDGYRTAYFEDMPWIGTFQYRFNGWNKQPADHYLRSFYLEESNNGKKWYASKQDRYCVGDTPQYALMLNITDQFFQLDKKKFCFTFIADITHDDFNMIATADEDFAQFLLKFKMDGRLDDTLLLVMGDHGPRYANVRSTYRGKLEERLPLMGIVLPERLKRARPEIEPILRSNAEALTTPHDIHAMLLDALDMTQHWNPEKIKGADLPRGLTLFQPIPQNRTCSEAGIETHWCTCMRWVNVSREEPVFQRAGEALVAFINGLTEEKRANCVPRTLTYIEYVMRQRANSNLLKFASNKDVDGYVGKFNANTKINRQDYSLKIVVGPGEGVYEASTVYNVKENEFEFDSRSISRTNAYGHEPDCISATHPHLNMFCYCND